MADPQVTTLLAQSREAIGRGDLATASRLGEQALAAGQTRAQPQIAVGGLSRELIERGCDGVVRRRVPLLPSVTVHLCDEVLAPRLEAREALLVRRLFGK